MGKEMGMRLTDRASEIAIFLQVDSLVSAEGFSWGVTRVPGPSVPDHLLNGSTCIKARGMR